jgi:hypothetical protein
MDEAKLSEYAILLWEWAHPQIGNFLALSWWLLEQCFSNCDVHVNHWGS